MDMLEWSLLDFFFDLPFPMPLLPKHLLPEPLLPHPSLPESLLPELFLPDPLLPWPWLPELLLPEKPFYGPLDFEILFGILSSSSSLSCESNTNLPPYSTIGSVFPEDVPGI